MEKYKNYRSRELATSRIFERANREQQINNQIKNVIDCLFD